MDSTQNTGPSKTKKIEKTIGMWFEEDAEKDSGAEV